MVDRGAVGAVQPPRPRQQRPRPVRRRARLTQRGPSHRARLTMPARGHEHEHHMITRLQIRLRRPSTGPTSSTIPAASCPNAIGIGRGRFPLITDRSEWHKPAALIRTSTSPGPGGSSSNVSNVNGCEAAYGDAALIAANTAALISTVTTPPPPGPGYATHRPRPAHSPSNRSAPSPNAPRRPRTPHRNVTANPSVDVDPRPRRPIRLRVLHKIRIPERQPVIREIIHRLLPPDHAIRIILQESAPPDSASSRTAVSTSCEFIMNPPSPHTANTRRCGYKNRRHHRRRQTRTHRRQRIIQQQRVRDRRPIITGKPNLVHAVIQRDNPIIGHHRPHISHNPLRSRRETTLRRPSRNPGQNTRPHRQQRRRIRQPTLQPIRQQRQTRPHITHHRSLRRIHLLHIRRRITHMNHRRPTRTHQ